MNSIPNTWTGYREDRGQRVTLRLLCVSTGQSGCTNGFLCSVTIAQNWARDSQLSKMYSWNINTGPTHNFRLSTRQHTPWKSKSGMSQQQRQFRRVQVGLIVIVLRGSTNSKNKYSSNNAMNVNPSSCSSPPARAVYSLQQKRWTYKRTPSLQPAQPSVNWISSEEERPQEQRPCQTGSGWRVRYSNKTASTTENATAPGLKAEGGKENSVLNKGSSIYLPLHYFSLKILQTVIICQVKHEEGK